MSFDLTLSREHQPQPAGFIPPDPVRDKLARECMAENRPRLMGYMKLVQTEIKKNEVRE
jgi:hypothetical protein